MRYKIEHCPFRLVGKPAENWIIAYNFSIINVRTTGSGPLDGLIKCVARKIVNEANKYELENYEHKPDRFHFRVKEMS